MPGEYTGNGLEPEPEPKVKHVHCIGPTIVRVFDTGLEAIEAYEAYEDIVVIHIGEDQSEANKDQIEVMSLNEYMGHMGEDIE